MTTKFYEEWEPRYEGGRLAPETVEDRITYGVEHYSGDSGVGENELEAYLQDLAETAAGLTEEALGSALARLVSSDETVFVWGKDPDEPKGDVFIASTAFARLLLAELRKTRPAAVKDSEAARFEATGGSMFEGADQ